MRIKWNKEPLSIEDIDTMSATKFADNYTYPFFNDNGIKGTKNAIRPEIFYEQITKRSYRICGRCEWEGFKRLFAESTNALKKRQLPIYIVSVEYRDISEARGKSGMVKKSAYCIAIDAEAHLKHADLIQDKIIVMGMGVDSSKKRANELKNQSKLNFFDLFGLKDKDKKDKDKDDKPTG